MKKVFLIIIVALAFISCKRRPLTYAYTPKVEIILYADWADMSVKPTGMSVYCYPESGESPTIKQTNNVDSAILNLGVGVYKILVFNQVPSDFGTIDFSGLDYYETAEVFATSTTSKWYESKAEESLVQDPEELAIATYHTIEVTQEAVEEVLGLREKYDGTDYYIEPYKVIYVEPKVVIKTTRVTVKLDGFHNLSAARATLYGMAEGYDISEQKSHANYVTHLLESWSANEYLYDVTQGEIITYFTCFGIPETTTATRELDESWGGTMHLEMLLVDDSTIIEADYPLYEFTTLLYEEELEADDEDNRSGDEDGESEDDSPEYDDDDVDISVDLDGNITLPDVKPVGGSTGGFNANVTDWGEEEDVEIPT